MNKHPGFSSPYAQRAQRSCASRQPSFSSRAACVGSAIRAARLTIKRSLRRQSRTCFLVWIFLPILVSSWTTSRATDPLSNGTVSACSCSQQRTPRWNRPERARDCRARHWAQKPSMASIKASSTRQKTCTKRWSKLSGATWRNA